MTEDGQTKRAAMGIAKRGIRVFPCGIQKRPLVKWKDQATDDPARVAALWTKTPGEYIGVVTGSASGFFVLDIDHLPAIAELPFALPRTLTAKTRSGGRHMYFKYAPGVRNSAGEIAPDVDVRGEGGYVIAPPSPGYAWVDRSPIAEAPEELLDLIREKPANPAKQPPGRRASMRKGLSDNIYLDGETIPNGARNNTLARIAGRLHDGSRDLADLEAALLKVNERYCSPALPAGDVLKIARSIYRYEPCTPGKGEAAETGEALARFERAMLNYPFGRYKSGLSITKALLSCGREFGRLMLNGGVAFNLTYAELALRAAVSEEAIRRYTKRIKETGLVRQDNAERKAKEAGTWVLMPPAPTVGTPPTSIGNEPVGVCTHTSCAASLMPLTRPRLRYSERFIRRLGKSWEACRDVLEANGGVMTYEALAEALNMKRPRDLRKPRPDGWLARAQRDGLVRQTSGGLALVEGWETLEEGIRERTGEIAAATRDQQAYKRRRKDWLDRINLGEIVKRKPCEEEMRARSELETLREAGRERARYRRQVKTFREERIAEKRRRNAPPRTLWSVRVMSNPDTLPGMLTESYWRGETSRFDSVVGAVAEFYRDGANWRAWREDVRLAYQEWETLEPPKGVPTERRRAG